MPLLGQASGGWTEGSSALRILYAGKRNSIGVLSTDSFTQTNPPAFASNVTDQVDQTLSGVLSGSVCFARPDGGPNVVGGPGLAATQVAIATAPTQAIGYKALGVFINSANGNSFENPPGAASGKGPYVSGAGTYGNGLFETAVQVTVGAATAGDAITYIPGMNLAASRNGYLMPTEVVAGGAIVDLNVFAGGVSNFAENFVRAASASATVVGVLKMAPDSEQNELVYDQRI